MCRQRERNSGFHVVVCAIQMKRTGIECFRLWGATDKRERTGMVGFRLWFAPDKRARKEIVGFTLWCAPDK